jgi:hypothetical protein
MYSYFSTLYFKTVVYVLWTLWVVWRVDNLRYRTLSSSGISPPQSKLYYFPSYFILRLLFIIFLPLQQPAWSQTYLGINKVCNDHRLSISRPIKRVKEKSPSDGHCQCEKEIDDHLLACHLILEWERTSEHHFCKLMTLLTFHF